MNADWRTRYELAIDAARQAGDLAHTYFEGAFEVEWKADQSPVTVADRRAEELVRALVARHFPADGFLGEEFGDQPGASGYRWVIDPVDGTKSFVRGIPLWGTLVGLEYRGETIAGVCYAPGLHLLWRALRGDGAYRGDRRIRVSDVAELSRSLLCYSSVSWFRAGGREAAFLELAARTERQRGYGDWYGFVLVAQGSAEVMVDAGLHRWDAAAPMALVEEAGGRFTDWTGRSTVEAADVLASNGKVHAETLGILNG
ncbi:MAG TPA: inositol monophosphatase family protein [Fimbriiglobus sp.]|nr:inositol monophosphatase family protein [Fimbriiglobus sp.]